MTTQQLEQALKEFPGVDASEVVVERNRRFVAKVLVPRFDGVDEADRQAELYNFLGKRFSDDEMVSVEYVFTMAPGDPA